MNGKKGFYEKDLRTLADKMLKLANSNDMVIVGMDANATRDPIQDVDWEDYQRERKNERMRQLGKDSAILNEWMTKMDLEDSWHRLFPEHRVYTREPLKCHHDGSQSHAGQNKIGVGKRLNYLLVNKSVNQFLGGKMYKLTEIDWVSEHELIRMNMMGMPLIRAEMRNVFQRPIFKLDNLDAQKDSLQSMVQTLLKEARLKEDGLAWLEMNLEKTGTFRNLEANYKSVKGYKDIKTSTNRITDILRQGKGEDWQKAIDIIIEEIRGNLSSKEKDLKNNLVSG